MSLARAPIEKRALSGRTAIIAGSGQLPIEVARTLVEQGKTPFIVPLRGSADPVLYQFDHQEISIVEFAKLIKTLKQENIQNVVLAGGVQSRPHLKDLRFDAPTLKALPRVIYALGRGDDALLRAFMSLIESYGFRVAGAHDVVPDLLAPVHVQLTKIKVDKHNKTNIRLAAHAASLLGALDVGQGAVVVGGRVVALEGAEGTDNMLKRVREMRAEKRIPAKGGVLVKCAKPNQDARADLPAIGPQTIENIASSCLDGVAIEAQQSFILEVKKTVALADIKGVFIVTFKSGELT